MNIDITNSIETNNILNEDLESFGLIDKISKEVERLNKYKKKFACA